MSNNYGGLQSLKKDDPVTADRCARRLLRMRRDLKTLVNRKSDSSLLLATWNIRDFGAAKFGQGDRLRETLYYIAEIISCFDLVAVQEVNRNLDDLLDVMEILGREWDFIATDTTEGSGGNGERMAFVYNQEKVWFRKIAGEIVLPKGQMIVSPNRTQSAAEQEERPVEAALDSGLIEAEQQFARTPFVVAFQSGWFKFNLCTVHIYYGEDSGPGLQRRIGEIRSLVKFFADRQDKENTLVGDDPRRGRKLHSPRRFQCRQPRARNDEGVAGARLCRSPGDRWQYRPHAG